jgi:hypothetical protein
LGAFFGTRSKFVKPFQTVLPDPFATLVQLTAGALSAPVAMADDAVRPAARRRSLFDRLDAWLWTARQRDLEHALAGATDVADLESRLRDQVGMFGRYV